MAPTTPIVPTTLLEAVNELLQAVGTAAVMTLDDVSTDEDTQKAFNTISDASVQVQSQGWHFNTDEDMPLLPDPATGYILLPSNAVRVSKGWRSRDRFFTERNRQLYDLKNHTFVWINGTSGMTTPQPLLTGQLYVDMVQLFTFENVPQPIRWLIMAKAGRLFAVGRVPDSDTYKFSETTYEDALAAAMQYDEDSRAQEPGLENPHFRWMRAR